MRNLYFPTTIVDGFFEYPDEIRNYGLQLLKNDNVLTSINYPGKRSRPIQEINSQLFNAICNKFVRMFFPIDWSLKYSANMYFQSVEGVNGSGWIHREPTVATGIIYLTPHQEKNIGTSIYRQKDLFSEKKIAELGSYRDQAFMNQNDASEQRENVDSNFDEVIRVEGLYNRALMFDGSFFHKAHDFIGNSFESSRLTIVMFFHAIQVGAQHYPIPRSKLYQEFQI